MGIQALERVGQDRKRVRVGPGVWRVVREVVLLATLFLVYTAGRQIAASNTGANLYYASVHAPLTGAVLLWLSIWRPQAYPRVRWTMVSVTGLALIGHIVFPLAPPRMMPGFVDTGLRFGQSVYGPDMASGPANQFAAMPSLHVGWAALIALSMILITRSKWRWLWLAHPIITFAVVVVTANHYWMDGIVVLILLAVSLPLLLGPGLRADRPQTRNSVSPRRVLK